MDSEIQQLNTVVEGLGTAIGQLDDAVTTVIQKLDALTTNGNLSAEDRAGVDQALGTLNAAKQQVSQTLAAATAAGSDTPPADPGSGGDGGDTPPAEGRKGVRKH